MSRNAYAADKAAMHPERLVVLRNGGQPYPVFVHMVLSDLCNQDCSFCAYRTEGYPSNQNFTIRDEFGETIEHNPNRMLPFDKVIETIECFQPMGVRAVLLTGGGEPTIYPQFGEVTEALDDCGIDLGVNTNGLLLGHDRCYRLPYAKWVRVSVDSGTAETYAKTRRVSSKQFDRVLQNIHSFSEVPRRHATLGVGFVVTRGNYHELSLAVRKFRDAGADNVRISANLNTDGSKYYDGLYYEIMKQCEEARGLETDDFRVFDNFASRYGELDAGNPEYRDCGYMHFTTYIGGDQKVYVCCVNAYSDRGCIGSIEDMSFKELWDSEMKQEMFDNFDARGCVHCQFNDRNIAIRRLVEGPTGHDSFV